MIELRRRQYQSTTCCTCCCHCLCMNSVNQQYRHSEMNSKAADTASETTDAREKDE